MEIKGIHHFSIVVKDIKDTLKFYHDLGQLEITKVDVSEDEDIYHLKVENDGELQLIDYKGKQNAEGIPTRAVRFHHIAFFVDDPKEYYKRFLPHGYSWPFILNHGDIYGHYAACPNDPNGVMVEWLHPYEPIPNNYFIEKDFSVCTGYHHFCIYVGDREASFRLYRDVLGMKEAREVLNFDMIGAPADAYYFQVPGSGELELIDNRGVQVSMPVDPLRVGAKTMAFVVDDAQAFCDLLVSKGYEACMDNGICRMVDPNGVFLEFIE